MASYTSTGSITFPWTTASASVTTLTATMQQFGTACTNATTTWQQWVNNGYSSWTVASGGQVWDVWQEWHQPIMRSAEEEQARQDRLQAQREEESRRRLAAMERMAGARERARVLLDELVAADDWVPGLDLIQVVGSDGDLYRIEMHRDTVHGNVVRVDEHGCILGRACVAPSMNDGGLAMPMEDGWLGQYLGLKYNAEEFLSHANWSSVRDCRQPDVPILRAA